MDVVGFVIQGLAEVSSPGNLGFLLLGVVLGMFVGLLPGLGAATGVAILIPLTTDLDALSALIMLAGIYYGSQYGGSITSILIRTPGEASQVMTAIEGYELARNGRAGPALAMSAVASFVAGTLTIPLLMFLAPALSNVALRFGPPEMFALMVFALLSVASMTSKGNQTKGIAAAALGVWLSTIGFDPQTGIGRFDFGQIVLLLGIGFVPVVIGVFAVGEVLGQVGAGSAKPIRARLREMLLTREDLRVSVMPTLRSSFLGFFVGVLPGAGATVASFFGYDIERRLSRHAKKFGSGVIEGVAAPEAANNSAVNGAFVPALTLGIPGSATTAVLLGAMILHGITPGPQLMSDEPRLVWGLIASFYVGNLMLLVLSLPFAPAFASLLRLRYSLMYPVILVVGLLGGFAVANNMLGVWIVIIFGAVGYVMNKQQFPLAPLVLGHILGGMMETALVQTSSLAQGDMTIMLQRPISLIFLILSVILLVFGPIARLLRKPIGRLRSDVGTH